MAKTIEPKEQPDAPTVDVEEIPLPPEELWDELDNQSGDGAKISASGGKPAEPEVAKLDFVDAEKREHSIPLDHPFRFEGRVVESISVRRLITDEVGALLGKSATGDFTLYDAYSAMTGLPAAVLRGLDETDGDRVTGACYDFLPRVFRRTESGSSSD